MSECLPGLPYEVVSIIIIDLTFDEIVNLARTCKRLQYLLYEESICRWITEYKIPSSKEAIAAKSNGRGFAFAVRRFAARRAAFANAEPYSVAIVAFGDSYLYSNGALCYILNAQIRVLHLHDSSQEEAVISISSFLQTFLPDYGICKNPRLEFLSYNKNILCFLLAITESETETQSWLVAVDIERGTKLFIEKLEVTEKIFARHDEQYLFYGTHSDRDVRQNKRWVIRGYQFHDEKWFEDSVHLSNMVGSDIGSTISFELHGDYFYALSSETSDEPEEVDWTSFYHCFRFPLNSPCDKLLESTPNNLMWRRQHSEGPIDDRWSNLRLDCDEESNDFRIVEARREWHMGGSRSRRTYYITPIQFPDKGTLTDCCSDHIELGHARQNLPDLPNSQLLATLTSDDNPHYMKPQLRLPQNVHPGDDGYDRSAFVLNKTKIRYYHTCANAYMDLVDDPIPHGWETKQRLRLRIGSRKRCRTSEESDYASRSAPAYEYRPSPIKMWPPDAPEFDEIYALLSPPSHTGNVHGTADERSMVYCTGGNPNQPAAIVFISFDPGLKLSGLRKWRTPGIAGIGEGPHIDGRATGAGRMVTIDQFDGQENCKGKGKENSGVVAESTAPLLMDRHDTAIVTSSVGEEDCSGLQNRMTGEQTGWFWTESAMYKDIDRGFWFERAQHYE